MSSAPVSRSPGAPAWKAGSERLLTAAARSMRLRSPRALPDRVRVGVDLGTAYTVLVVTEESGMPLVGASQFADVVRDGIVWDFAGAQRVVAGLKESVERRAGRTLTHAAVTIPPAVSESDHRAHRYVLESVGLECTAVVDEPTAANAVLGIRDGAVVDIGGGTTGIAILREGVVVATDDEPTGGKHLTLVLAGALGISIEEAEERKQDPANHSDFLPIVRPTLEKIGTIVARQIRGHDVGRIYLVGGTAAFSGIAPIIADITSVPAEVPAHPLFVTPLGVASFDTGGEAAAGGWERDAAARRLANGGGHP